MPGRAEAWEALAGLRKQLYGNVAGSKTAPIGSTGTDPSSGKEGWGF